MTEAPATGDYSPELLVIAAERANGPGAIFVGDLNDLVGPAPTKEEDDADGNVPLSALESHRFVYESDYTALERAILDAGVTGGDAGYGQRWYEVTGYINGPLTSWPSSHNVINADVWESIPQDLQEIMKEEAAKLELEALRLGSIQNELGLQKNIDAGMIYVEFGPEMRALSDKSVLENVVPNWVGRVGGPDAYFVQVFNEAIGPGVGLRVESDGTVTRTP